jgi:hypothetical protein
MSYVKKFHFSSTKRQFQLHKIISKQCVSDTILLVLSTDPVINILDSLR